MHFLEWVKQSGNKVLLTDRVKKANAVIRNGNRKSGQDICQLRCMTIQQIAEEVLIANMAQKGIVKCMKMLKPKACVYLLNNILYREKYAFLPEECYSIRTTEAVYQSMEQVRMNHRTELFVQEQVGKAAQLKCMIECYEAALKAEESYDIASLLAEAVGILNGLEDKEALVLLLPWLKECSLAGLADVEFTALEMDFLEKLQSLLHTDILQLEYCVPVEKVQVKYRFFKGYGIVNEVRYAVKQILEKKLPFGEVNLFYTQKEYEPFIKGLLGKHKIAYRFLTGEGMQENNLLRFVSGVLQFAEEDFLYERLADVIENPWMTFQNVAKEVEGEKSPSPVTCYNHFLRKGIGWGMERYEACIQRVEVDEAEAQKYKYFLDFLRMLADVFQDGTDCGGLYSRLMELVGKYTHVNEERNYIYAVLKEQTEVFEQVEKQETLQATIHIIKENLKGIEAKQDAATDAVSVVRIQNREVLERAHNFFIGLSAKQFMADAKESPVLSDKELQLYLEGKVELAKDAGSRVRENILGTLATLEAGTVYMGYSTFDTVDLKEGAPSVLYLDCLESWGKQEEIEYQGFDIVEGAIKVAKWKPPVDVDAAEEAEQAGDEAGQLEENGLSCEMSPSALHTLIDCPLRYYYHYVKGLAEREFLKKNESGWLNAAKKGNLFHQTMQIYCEEVLMQAGETDEAVNEEVFCRIFEQEVVKMLEEQPYISQVAFEQEKQEAFKCCLNYLTVFQKELSDAGKTDKPWKVLGCETSFEKYPYVIKNPENEQENFTVLFQGTIDRLDGYVDEEATLHLRVVDYKTGKLSNFEKDLKENRKLQHYIYVGAAQSMAMEIEKKQKFEKLLQKPYEKVDIESVQYVFPYEKDMNLDATRADKKYSLPDSVGIVIVGCLGPLALGDEELAHQNMKTLLDNRSDKDLCKYCTYSRQCRRKLGEQ